MKPVTVNVPASTSNLGSGFDTLGLAVSLHSRVEVRRTEAAGIQLESEFTASARPQLLELFTGVAELFFQSTNTASFGVVIRLSGNVPIARGLGYSATLRVGLLAGLNELSDARLSKERLLTLATLLEQHPDNASPSIFGGFTVSGLVNGQVRCLHFEVPEELKLVTLIPDFTISTEEARKLMPASYSKSDTAHGLNRAALITAAFAAKEYEALRGIFDDKVHQPYRQRLIPVLHKTIQAGENAGALGGFLSGSGSGIICLALENAQAVGKAMQSTLPNSQLLVLTADNVGYTVG